jgi:hypothetical protein
MDKFIENVVEDAEELYGDIQGLFDGEVAFNDILGLVGALVETVESFSTVAGEGETKKQQVIEAFDYLNEKYGIVEAIDKAVKWPIYLVPAELIDGTMIEWAIKGPVIDAIVWGLNKVK